MRDFTHTDEKGRARTARGYALIGEDGKPIYVGLFVNEQAAERYCEERGWRFVRPA